MDAILMPWLLIVLIVAAPVLTGFMFVGLYRSTGCIIDDCHRHLDEIGRLQEGNHAIRMEIREIERAKYGDR